MKSPKRKLPFYVPILTGLFLVTIGGLVLVTALGLVPTTSQDFHSPRWMVGAVGAGLFFGGVLIWLPRRAPVWLSTGLGVLVWVMLLAVLNFTALVPSQIPTAGGLNVGPFTQTPIDPKTNRLMVGTLAVVADLYSVWWIIQRVYKLPTLTQIWNDLVAKRRKNLGGK
jgi:predicted secreted protein